MDAQDVQVQDGAKKVIHIIGPELFVSEEVAHRYKLNGAIDGSCD